MNRDKISFPLNDIQIQRSGGRIALRKRRYQEFYHRDGDVVDSNHCSGEADFDIYLFGSIYPFGY